MNKEIIEAVRLMKEDEENRWRLSLVHLNTAQRNSVLKTYESINKSFDIDYPRTLLTPPVQE
jgi:hypothetical protein